LSIISLFDVETDIAWLQPKRIRSSLELMQKNDPAIFNQAIMEFGALQCVLKSRTVCVFFNSSCAALQKKK
jgi:A/G-specific adenine glycosylase